jgi:hypothetical protein
MMKKMRAVCGLGLLVVISACNKKAAETDVPGRYFADYGFAKETLQLTPDRKFDQEIKLTSSGRVAAAHGTWRFEKDDSDIYFSDDFLVVTDGLGALVPDFNQPSKKAIAILPVRRRFGNVQIGLDPAIPYKKLR